MKRLWLMALYGLLILTSLSYAQDAEDPWSVWAGSDGNDFEIYYAHHQGGQWSAPQRLTQDNAFEDVSPSIAVDEQGKPVVVWIREKEDRREIYGSKWDGMKWSPEELVNDSTNLRFSQPSVAFDHEGQIWVVATGVDINGGQDEIYWTHRTSSGWSGWSRLNQEDATPDVDPTILGFEKKVWAVWIGFDGERYRLFGRIWDGQEWGAEERLFPSNEITGEFPSLTIQDGKPSLIFYQKGKTFLSQRVGQAWSAPVPTTVPLEAVFIDLWKNQGTSGIQLSWFNSPEKRGSLRVLLDYSQDSGGKKNLVAMIRNFFKISGREAWAAINPNVYTAFGDSITGGFMGSTYVPLLESRLNSKFGPSTVINRGVGGERTTEGIGRINSVLNADNPEFILIMEGTNDVGDERSPDFIAFNLELMIDRSIAFGTRPIISTITPRLNHNGGVERTNDLIRPLAGRKGIPLADNYAVIISQPTPVFDSLYVDHVHFNNTGNDLIAQTWFNVINGLKGGDGGGGCGSIRSVSGDRWNINLEPLFLVILFLFLASILRRLSRSL
jgi:lysophospholipase L1-like esterase